MKHLLGVTRYNPSLAAEPSLFQLIEVGVPDCSHIDHDVVRLSY